MQTTNKNLKIEIRPIPGRNGIREFSENLEYFSQSHTIGPAVNPLTRRFESGLTEEDKKYLKSINFPYDVSEDYIQGVPHPFWESSLIKTELQNAPTFLYPDSNPIDYIKYRYLKQSRYVYSGEEEMRDGAKPEATHFLYDEKVSISIKANKLEQKNSLIKNISNLSLARKRNIILIVLNENTDNKDEDYLTVRFEDILDNPENKSVLEGLLELSAAEVEMKATVKAGIQKNVFRRTKQGIFYFETNLGYSEEDVVNELLKPENQELLLTIKEKIK